jgi:hypothetical protein
VKRSKFFVKSCILSRANGTGAIEFAALHGMVLEPKTRKIQLSAKHYLAPLLLALIPCLRKLVGSIHHLLRLTNFFQHYQ